MELKDNIVNGKILKIKHGYNPNSSSLGSTIFALPIALFGITAGFGIISSFIYSCFLKRDSNQNQKNELPRCKRRGI